MTDRATKLQRFVVPLTVLHPDHGPGWSDIWSLAAPLNDESARIVIREIAIEDGYHLRALDLAGTTVIDIGANIGVFSAACLQMGAAHVIAIEPEPTNVRMLRKNLAEWIDTGQATIIAAAVGGEAGKTTVIGEATAAHTEYDGNGPVVEQVTLASIVETVTTDIALLKLDTEGAEYQIVDAVPSSALARCRRIVVEYHADVATLYLPPDDGRYDRLLAKLQQTHAVTANGSPNVGGTIWAYPHGTSWAQVRS